MSFFDPQSLYVHHQRSTKKGQIIQKKPKNHVSATSASDIPFAEAVLKNHSYFVRPPGYVPTVRSYLSQYATFSYTEDIYSSSLYNIGFNEIWLANRAAFSQLLSIPDSRLSGESYVIISLSTIKARYIPNYHYVQTTITLKDEGTDHLVININDSAIDQEPYIVYALYKSQTSAVMINSQGDTYDYNFSTPPAPGELSSTTTVNTWNQLKSDTGLDTDITLVQTTVKEATMPLAEQQVNGFIQVKLGVYVS